MKPKIIQKGAEAEIILDNSSLRRVVGELDGGKIIIKKRISKSYRIKELDEKIRKLRTRSEAKIIEKASKIIPTPKIIKSDEKSKEIIMEFIDGKKLSDHLDSFQLKEQKEIMKNAGESIAKIHDEGIIHGDLTTSNMIYSLTSTPKASKGGGGDAGEKKGEVYLIDFGLGYFNGQSEDKAVDLHLLKEALEAKHFKNHEELFKNFLKGYEKSKEYKKTLERLKAVERRGRYKDKY